MSKTQKLKRFLSYLFRAHYDTRGINQYTANNRVIVNIHYPLKFRYYYRLISLLRLIGYDVVIYLPSSRSFYNLARLEGGLGLLPPVKLISTLPKLLHSAVYCSDQQDRLWNRDWQKKIYLELELGKPARDVINPIHIPYSVHDHIHRCFWKERDRLLNNTKTIRMFFSGAYHGYMGREISKFLGKMERQEIVEIYRSHPNTVTITNQNQLDEILAGPPSKKYYWVDSDQFRVSSPQWLRVLSQAEVFLCPPGVVNVMSYNANEAIAMGTIPLLNYPEWFHPPLTDHVNSFVFSNQAELIECLDQIAEYSTDKLLMMRQKILHYVFIRKSLNNRVLYKDESKTYLLSANHSATAETAV